MGAAIPLGPIPPIKFGLQYGLSLGQPRGGRDSGFAKDFVEAIWRAMQAPTADDYVVATGESHTVRELVRAHSAAQVSITTNS